MEYQIRLASEEDIPRILAIYNQARTFMANTGNPNQWGNNWPDLKQVRKDISGKYMFALVNSGIIHGVFVLIDGEDPTYQEIYDGAWHFNLPYAAIHRVAGDGGGSVFRTVVKYASRQYQYLRVDTHKNNYPMRRAIEKAGFQHCGIILTKDGTPRLAFDRKF